MATYYTTVENRVASYLNITNFELLQTGPKPNYEPLQKVWTSNFFSQKQAKPRPKSDKTELLTLPNPDSSTKTELRTHPNPPKISNSKPTYWVRPNNSREYNIYVPEDMWDTFGCHGIMYFYFLSHQVYWIHRVRLTMRLLIHLWSEIQKPWFGFALWYLKISWFLHYILPIFNPATPNLPRILRDLEAS